MGLHNLNLIMRETPTEEHYIQQLTSILHIQQGDAMS